MAGRLASPLRRRARPVLGAAALLASIAATAADPPLIAACQACHGRDGISESVFAIHSSPLQPDTIWVGTGEGNDDVSAGRTCASSSGVSIESSGG